MTVTLFKRGDEPLTLYRVFRIAETATEIKVYSMPNELTPVCVQRADLLEGRFTCQMSK